MTKDEKRKIIDDLIKLRTEYMYDSHIYQGIEKAIQCVEKTLDSIPVE